MANVLADLLVKLSADSAELRTEIGKAKGELTGFAQVTAEATETIKHLFEYEVIKEAAQAFGEFVRSGAEAGEQLIILSQKVGVSVEDMSRLSFAANMVGSNGEAVSGALVRLSKNMEDAGAGTGKAQIAFDALGISVRDAGTGALRPSVDVMGDVAEAFSHMENGSNKTALAVMLFGRAGADMIPLLNKGREGISDLMSESDQLGRTMSGEVARGAAEFNEGIKKLQGGMTVLAASVAAELAPSLNNLIETFAETGNRAEQTATAAEGIVVIVKAIATGAMYGAEGLEMLGTRLGGFMAAVAATAHGDFSLASNIRAMTEKDIDAIGEKWDARIGSLWKPDADADAQARAEGRYISHHEEAKGPGPDIAALQARAKAQEDAAKEYQKANAEVDKLIASSRMKSETSGQDKVAEMAYRIQQGDLGDKLATIAGTNPGAAAAKAEELMRLAASLEELDKQAKAIETIRGEMDHLTQSLAKTGGTVVDETVAKMNTGKLRDALGSLSPSARDFEIEQLLNQASAVDDKKKADADAAEVEKQHNDLIQEGANLTAQLRTPTEEYAAAQSRLNDLLAGGAITWDTYGRAQQKAAEDFRRASEEQNTLARPFMSGLQSIFANVFEDQRIDKAFANLLKRLAAQALAEEVMIQLGFKIRGEGGLQGIDALGGLVKSLFGGGGGGGGVPTYPEMDLSGVTGADVVNEFGGMMPGMAAGGDVGYGRPYLIGEKGPELFVPDTSGTIVPNTALAAGQAASGGDQHFHYHGALIDRRGVQDWAREYKREIAKGMTD